MDNFKQAIELLFGHDPELRKIIFVTLQMSFASTVISSVIGIPLGTMLGRATFRGKGLIDRVNGTLMSLPPVVAGLLVFLLLSRSGPLGSLKLLYSVSAMVIAQVILITPIIVGMTSAIISKSAAAQTETLNGLNVPKFRQLKYLLYDSKTQLIAVALTGFGRSIAEVGAVQLVGGNIQNKTRVMTTAIMLETNMGNFGLAIALGMVLLLISFAVNSLVRGLERRTAKRRLKGGGTVD